MAVLSSLKAEKYQYYLILLKYCNEELNKFKATKRNTVKN